MIRFGLGTFLEVTSETAEKKIKLYERQLKGKGYPYYRELYDAVNLVVLNGASEKDARAIIEKIKNFHQKKYLCEAFDAFGKLYFNKGFKFHKVPSSELISSAGFLKIDVRPIALLDGDQGREIVYPWAKVKPKLQQKDAGIGIDILTRCFAKDSIKMFAIADLRQGLGPRPIK